MVVIDKNSPLSSDFSVLSSEEECGGERSQSFTKKSVHLAAVDYFAAFSEPFNSRGVLDVYFGTQRSIICAFIVASIQPPFYRQRGDDGS